MVDDMHMDDMLLQINSKKNEHEKAFSDLELRYYLKRLEEDNKVMIAWDTLTVYMI